jgi:hypothetical protein
MFISAPLHPPLHFVGTTAFAPKGDELKGELFVRRCGAPRVERVASRAQFRRHWQFMGNAAWISDKGEYDCPRTVSKSF